MSPRTRSTPVRVAHDGDARATLVRTNGVRHDLATGASKASGTFPVGTGLSGGSMTHQDDRYGPDAELVTLSVPAVPGYLTVVRLAAASMGSRAGLDIEEVDDLRIAADELSFLLMDSGATGANLDFTFTIQPARLTVSCRRDGWPDGQALPAPSGLMEQILTKVVESLVIDLDSGGVRFRLVKNRAVELDGERA